MYRFIYHDSRMSSRVLCHDPLRWESLAQGSQTSRVNRLQPWKFWHLTHTHTHTYTLAHIHTQTYTHTHLHPHTHTLLQTDAVFCSPSRCGCHCTTSPLLHPAVQAPAAPCETNANRRRLAKVMQLQGSLPRPAQALKAIEGNVPGPYPRGRKGGASSREALKKFSVLGF